VKAGMLVTVSSRSMAGRVEARYGYEGGGLQLKDAGAILAGDLSGAQARLLQMVALGLDPDVARAADLIRHYADCD
jgi:L-asparaginase